MTPSDPPGVAGQSESYHHPSGEIFAVAFTSENPNPIGCVTTSMVVARKWETDIDTRCNMAKNTNLIS